MRDCACQYERDDLHIAVRMHAKSLMSCDDVIVEHPERTKMHILWIMVVRKREKMLALEPRVAGSIAGMCGTDFERHEKGLFTRFFLWFLKGRFRFSYEEDEKCDKNNPRSDIIDHTGHDEHRC